MVWHYFTTAMCHNATQFHVFQAKRNMVRYRVTVSVGNMRTQSVCLVRISINVNLCPRIVFIVEYPSQSHAFFTIGEIAHRT